MIDGSEFGSVPDGRVTLMVYGATQVALVLEEDAEVLLSRFSCQFKREIGRHGRWGGRVGDLYDQ